MRNSEKKVCTRQSCSVSAILRDISSSPSFSTSKELAGVYSSLVSSFLREAQLTWAEANLRRDVDGGWRTARSSFHRHGATPHPANAWTSMLEIKMNASKAAGEITDMAVAKSAARACGYLAYCVEALSQYVSLVSGGLTPAQETAIKAFSNGARTQTRYIVMFPNWEQAVFEAIESVTGVNSDDVKRLIGGNAMMGSMRAEFAGFLIPKIVEYLLTLAPPSITDYSAIVNNDVNDPSEVAMDVVELLRTMIEEKKRDPATFYATYPRPDIDKFLKDFEFGDENPLTIGYLADGLVNSAITSSVPNSADLFNGSRTKPDYKAATIEVIDAIRSYGPNNFNRMFLAVAVSYVILHHA